MRANRLLVPIVGIILLTTLFVGLVTVSATPQTSIAPSVATKTVDTVSASGMKHVIFRDDDVGPWANLDTLKAVNQVHINEHVPSTLGITPHPDTSDSGNELLMDTSLLDYLQ